MILHQFFKVGVLNRPPSTLPMNQWPPNLILSLVILEMAHTCGDICVCMYNLQINIWEVLLISFKQ